MRAQFSVQASVNDEKKVDTGTKHICRDCWERRVVDANQCQVLVKETARNVESLFCIPTGIEWDVAKQRIPVFVEWNRKKGKRESKEMPWECFVKIKAVRKHAYRLVLKADAPDGVVVASVVYFLCTQYLTAGNGCLDPQLQGLAEWFVVNYLRILDMDRFASRYEQLWSTQKPEKEEAKVKAMVDETKENEGTYVVPYYDFWVQKMGKPTEKNLVTVDMAKSFIWKQRDKEYQASARRRWKWRHWKGGKDNNGVPDKGEQDNS